MPVVTSYDTFAVNAATGMKLVLNPAGTEASWSMSPTIRPRTNQVPVLDYATYSERRIPFTIDLVTGSVTLATFAGNVGRYFNPLAGPRTLLATADDGSTPLTIQASVTNLKFVPGFKRYIGEFLCVDPFWRATSTTTDGTSPLTVVGTYKALPVITVTPSAATMLRRRITVTDATGRGLYNTVIRMTFDSQTVSATASTNYVVFYGGRSVPFLVQAMNGASTTLDVRMNIPPLGSSYVDVYYGSAVANTITNNKLDDGGMMLTSGSFSLTNIVWDDFAIPGLIAATGSWRLAKLGQSINGVSYGIVSYDGTSIKIGLRPSTAAQLANDFDGIVCAVGIEAGTTNALAGLSRDDIAPSGGALAGLYNVKIATRGAGELTWTVKDTYPGGAARTTAVDIDGAVEIGVYIEPADTLANVDMELKASGTFQLTLDSSKTPTVSVGAAVAARVITGALTNTTTAKSISFPTTYLDAVDLVISCLAKTITPASGPVYNPPLPNDPDDWMYLAIGSNAWTLPAGATVSFGWLERYAQ